MRSIACERQPAGGNALLILAARHPERFDEVERLCQREGLSTIRRSDLPIDAEPRADAVILTPSASSRSSIRSRRRCSSAEAWCRRAATTSSSRPCTASRSCSVRTWRTSRRSPSAFLANGAAVQVRTPRELEDVVVGLMADPVRRARLGAAARALVDANRGAKDKTLKVLAELFPPRRAAQRSSAPSA